MSESKLEKIQSSLPPGSKAIQYPRSTSICGKIQEIVHSFILWHYIVWGFWMIGLMFACWYFNFASFKTLLGVTGFYFAQMAFYQPQFKDGLPLSIYGKTLYMNQLDPCLSYFDSIMIREGPEIDPSKLYMFAWMPHGILGICRSGSGGTAWEQLFPGVFPRWGSFGGAFYMPGIREFSLLASCIDAGRDTLTKLDQSINLIPGGIREMFFTDETSKVTKLVIKDRFGFVSLAKEKGMPLIPCFCFGEKWATRRVELPEYIAKFLMRNKLTGIGFIGQYLTFLPMNHKPMGWVFGQPIDTSKGTVAELHTQFMQATQDIFDKYKKDFEYDSDEEIEFVNVKETEKAK